MNKEEINKIVEYNKKIYSPEVILSSWLNLTLISITTCLVFYHMTRLKTIEMEPHIALIFSLILIIISMSFTIVAIFPYNNRINDIIDLCKKDKLCKKYTLNEINKVKYSFIGLAILTIVIEIGIGVLIIKNAIKDL